MLRARVAITVGFGAACVGLACSNHSKQALDLPAHTDGISATETLRTRDTSSAASLPVEASPKVEPTSSAPRDGDETSTALHTSASTETPTEVAAVPPLRDAQGLPLPQTEELPRLDSSSFKRRAELLFLAIQKDAPELAAPAFFPLVAYEQVKAISQPERDWNRRLLGAFARDIHEYHRQLGADAAGSKFLGVEAAPGEPRWMKPGAEGNRLGYYRVLRSRLKVGLPNGQERKFEITSMISWRGQWYVVHLHGFK